MQVSFSTKSPLETKADVLVLPLFALDKTPASELLTVLDEALSGGLLKAAKKVGFEAKTDASFLFQTWEGFAFDRVILWGLGKAEDITPESLWSHATKIARKVAKMKGTKSAALAWPAMPEGTPNGEALVEILTKGLVTGAYSFDVYKSEGKSEGKAKKEGASKIQLHVTDETVNPAKVKTAIERGTALAEGINLARDLVNHPANIMTPEALAQEAKKLGKLANIKVKVETEEAIAKREMHLFLAVARARPQPSAPDYPDLYPT